MSDLLIVDDGINQMNDTMKLALGVTGFASLLVLAVPSNFDVSKEEEQVKENPSTVAEKPVAAKPKPKIIVEDDEDEDFSFGDPIASTDPIDFDDFDRDNNSQSNATAKVKTAVSNRVISQPNQSNSFGSPAGSVQAAEGQSISTPISQGAPKPLPPQPPRKTIGTGGRPINSGGVSISEAR